MLDFRITFEARNPARHCMRHSLGGAGTDLFGVWVVEISYGRIAAAPGGSRSFLVRDKGGGLRHPALSILKRLATTLRRGLYG